MYRIEMETSWNIYQYCHSLPFSNQKNFLPSKTNIHVLSLIPYHSSHLTSSVYALSFIMIFVLNLKFASSNNIEESGIWQMANNSVVSVLVLLELLAIIHPCLITLLFKVVVHLGFGTVSFLRSIFHELFSAIYSLNIVILPNLTYHLLTSGGITFFFNRVYQISLIKKYPQHLVQFSYE